MTAADRLERLVTERELDALLVTDLTNIRYLTGFTGSNAICVVGPGLRAFVTDFRYVSQAAEQVRGFDRHQGKQDLLGDAVALMAGRVGFDDANLSVKQHERLSGLAGERIGLIAAGGLVERLRAVKQPDELERIRAAAALTDAMLEYVVERGLEGRSERDVAVDLEHEMRLRGAEPAFATIVASGAHGALPHAEPRAIAIEPGALVTIDLGCTLDGYCSDCTRTFSVGSAAGEAVAGYELVLDAQRAAVDAVRAGAGGKALDAVARDLIAAAGHGEHFGHGLGHGVGLDVHEQPRLSPLSDDTLVAGNVVTVEPGVYVPGRFGVRIEDLVFVEDDGREIVSHFPKELLEVS